MKLQFPVCLAVALTGWVAIGGEPMVLDNPALPPVERLDVRSHAPLTLVENSRFRFAIVGRFREEADFRGPEGMPLAKFGRNSVRRAANELGSAFEKCCGAKPSVLEEDDPRTSEFKYVIALGPTKWSEKLGLKPDELPREGFEVRTFPGGVCIAGMDGFRIAGLYDVYNWRCSRLTCNGTEWGAVDFLERFLGVRKFSLREKGDYEIHPPCSSLVVPPVAYRDHPRQLFRSGYNAEGWRVATSSDFFGGEAPSPFDLAKAHPDRIEDIFFRDGTGRLWQHPTIYGKNFLDVTNMRLADILVDDFKAYYAQNGTGTYWKATHAPSSRYLWFGQCDRQVKIENDFARAHRRENPRAVCDANSEIYGHFYKCLAERIQCALPDKRLVLMAYSSYLRAPRTVGRYPDNVQIMACIGTPALAASKVYMGDVRDCYREWNALCAHKCVPYLYHLSYGGDGGPIPPLMMGLFMGDFLRQIAPDVEDTLYYPCFGQFGRTEPLAAYLTYRSAWNPKYDALAGAHDYLTGLFGAEAGEHLFRAVCRMRALWLERYIPEVDKGPYVGRGTRCIPQLQHEALYVKMLTPDVLAELESAFDAAEKAVAGNKRRERTFKPFAAAFRKCFADARAYQGIRIGLFDIGRAPTKLPAFRKAYLDDGTRVVSPDAWLSWNERGLTLKLRSPAPFKVGTDLWDGDTFEFFLAPGEKPTNLYQFALASNGKYEDLHMQIDPPRAMDADWNASGLRYVACESDGCWTGELFIPWSALYDAPPKAGDAWRVNLISNRTQPSEYSSIAPTLNNNRRWKFYSRVTFVK